MPGLQEIVRKFLSEVSKVEEERRDLGFTLQQLRGERQALESRLTELAAVGKALEAEEKGLTEKMETGAQTKDDYEKQLAPLRCILEASLTDAIPLEHTLHNDLAKLKAEVESTCAARSRILSGAPAEQ